MNVLTEASYWPTEFFNPKWAEEMVQHVRAMAALLQNVDQFYNSYLMIHNHLYSSFRRSDPLFWPLWASGMKVVQNIHARTHKNKISEKSLCQRLNLPPSFHDSLEDWSSGSKWGKSLKDSFCGCHEVRGLFGHVFWLWCTLTCHNAKRNGTTCNEMGPLRTWTQVRLSLLYLRFY